jgi:hypothetical protein
MSELILKNLSSSNQLSLKTFTAGSEIVPIPGPQGEPGPEGASAYDVAVANGFKGSEKEWLATLKGEKGADGRPGVDGPQGPKGDTGPVGATGPQGPKGDTGSQGPKGDQGEKGDIPIIVASAGPNINAVGTPTVTTTIDGDIVTFVFNNLKGETGATPDLSDYTTLTEVQNLINSTLVEVENGSY